MDLEAILQNAQLTSRLPPPPFTEPALLGSSFPRPCFPGCLQLPQSSRSRCTASSACSASAILMDLLQRQKFSFLSGSKTGHVKFGILCVWFRNGRQLLNGREENHIRILSKEIKTRNQQNVDRWCLLSPAPQWLLISVVDIMISSFLISKLDGAELWLLALCCKTSPAHEVSIRQRDIAAPPAFWMLPPARGLTIPVWALVMTVRGFAERWDEGYKFNLGVSADQWRQSNPDLRLWIPEQRFHVRHTDDTCTTTTPDKNKSNSWFGDLVHGGLKV